MLMDNRSDRRPKNLITRQAAIEVTERMRIGCAAFPSGSAAFALQAKTEYRDAVSTYLPSTTALAINGEAI